MTKSLALVCLLASAALALSSCASRREATRPVEAAVDMVTESLDQPLPEEGPIEEKVSDEPDRVCHDDAPAGTWLDKTQQSVFWTVCGATRWFDGFFGDRSRYDASTQETYGRLGLGMFYDRRDGLDFDYRFRASVALPAVEAKARSWQARLRLGRGRDQELIEDRGTADSDALPSRFNEVEDASWLLGLGFQRGQKLDRGFNFDLGVRLRLPPDPYVKGRWFRNWNTSQAALLRLRQTVFWTGDRGLGETTQLDWDKLFNDHLLFRFANSGTIAEDRQGLDWASSVSLFQGLSNRRAITYRAFLKGETLAQSGLQNYGVEIRFRQRVLRKWLFLEYQGSASWPRFIPEEVRELNLGIGVGFEMYFGPVPDAELR